MERSRIVVLAASSDIGAHLARHHLARGADVLGTYRTPSMQTAELEAAGARMVALDIDLPSDVAAFAAQIRNTGFRWNVLVSAPGLLAPIGPFLETDFDAWERSVITNSTAQLRALHALHPLRDPGRLAKVIFFAGGGTNGPMDNYSAYCIGKLSLIKMTELLHSENPELQVSIIGTGWVKTKIHLQTIDAGALAGVNLDKTHAFLAGDTGTGSSLERVAACVDWCLDAPRAAVGGRNFSLVHDRWDDPAFLAELEADPDSYKLRRRS